MNYRRQSDGLYPVLAYTIQQLNPNVVLAAQGPTTADVQALGYDPVQATSQPSYDPLTQQLSEVAPVQVAGVWTQTWSVTQLPSSTVANLQAQALSSAQTTAISALTAAYANAIVQPVSFTTAGGVTKMFQADADSQSILQVTAQGYTYAGAVPSGFTWKSADNTFVPFTLADLHGLFLAMLAQGQVAWTHLQTQKAAVNAATTASAATAITW